MKQNILAGLIIMASNIFFMCSFSLVKLLSPTIDITLIMFFRFLAGFYIYREFLSA